MSTRATVCTAMDSSSPDSAAAATMLGAVPGKVPRNPREAPIRLLVFTSLYPNSVQPRHGIFVEERLRHLVASGRVTATVVAPVPWFPFRHRRFGHYATFARVPASEVRHGIRILHPRYPVVPKFGMNIAPSLMFRASLPVLRKIMAGGTEFDLIDAHYFYPDGVAAARIGTTLGKSVVITARGSDVNVIPDHPGARRQIQWAAQRAAAIVTVSRTLADKLVALDVTPEKIATLRNGVDLDRFGPRDRAAIRAGLGLSGPLWLTVGNLVELKGVHIVIEALAGVQDATLLIVGDGPEKSRLLGLTSQLGVGARVQFLGTVAQTELIRYYNAADALWLASSREGMPNVVLESIACGTPVVAAPFAGVSEVVCATEAGEIAASRTAEAMVAAWRRLQDRKPERTATRRIAEQFGWAPVVAQQCALYQQVLSARRGITERRAST